MGTLAQHVAYGIPHPHGSSTKNAILVHTLKHSARASCAKEAGTNASPGPANLALPSLAVLGPLARLVPRVHLAVHICELSTAHNVAGIAALLDGGHDLHPALRHAPPRLREERPAQRSLQERAREQHAICKETQQDVASKKAKT